MPTGGRQMHNNKTEANLCFGLFFGSKHKSPLKLFLRRIMGYFRQLITEIYAISVKNTLIFFIYL